MALGILNAKCSCKFDASNNCICTVTGKAQVDSAGDYIVLRCWWEADGLHCASLYAKDVEAGDPVKFRYEGSFDNTEPIASYYIITLAKSGEEDFIGSQSIIEPEDCCPTPTCSLRIN